MIENKIERVVHGRSSSNDVWAPAKRRSKKRLAHKRARVLHSNEKGFAFARS